MFIMSAAKNLEKNIMKKNLNTAIKRKIKLINSIRRFLKLYALHTSINPGLIDLFSLRTYCQVFFYLFLSSKRKKKYPFYLRYISVVIEV